MGVQFFGFFYYDKWLHLEMSTTLLSYVIVIFKMPPKTKLRRNKTEAPVYATEDGNDRVTNNRSGTKIDRMTNMDVRSKRKPSGKGDAARATR